jgi:hypothetical protein
LNWYSRALRSAQHSIHLAAYVFTSKPVATALLEARRRGVEVAVVADMQENQRQYSATRFLANQQLPVRLNGKYAILHDKFMIIDQQHVQTGSFNYTAAAASKNAENVLIIWNAPELAARYESQWQRLWQEASAGGSRPVPTAAAGPQALSGLNDILAVFAMQIGQRHGMHFIGTAPVAGPVMPGKGKAGIFRQIHAIAQIARHAHRGFHRVAGGHPTTIRVLQAICCKRACSSVPIKAELVCLASTHSPGSGMTSA